MVDEIKNINGVNVAGSTSTDFTAGQIAENKLSIFEELKKQYEAQLGRTLTPEETANLQAALLQSDDINIAEIFGFEKSQTTEAEAQEPVAEEAVALEQEAQVPITSDELSVSEPNQNFFEKIVAEESIIAEESKAEIQPEVQTNSEEPVAKAGGKLNFFESLVQEEKSNPQSEQVLLEKKQFELIENLPKSIATPKFVETNLKEEELRLPHTRGRRNPEDMRPDGKDFDASKYDAKRDSWRKKHYTEELAKNRFLYSTGSQKSIEDWENLDSKVKKSLIEQAEKDVVSYDLDYMTELKTASSMKLSLDAYRNMDLTERRIYKMYMYSTMPDEQKTEEIKKEEARFKQDMEIVQWALKEKGIEKEVTIENFYKILNSGNENERVNLGKAQYEYYSRIKEEDRTPGQQNFVELLSSMGAECLEEFGSGIPSEFDLNTLKPTSKADKRIYDNSNLEDRAKIEAENFYKTYGNNKEEYRKVITATLRKGIEGMPLYTELVKLSKDNPDFQDVLTSMGGDVDIFLSEQQSFLDARHRRMHRKNIGERFEDDPVHRRHLTDKSLNSMTNEQKAVEASSLAIEDVLQNYQDIVQDALFKIDDEKCAEEASKNYSEAASLENKIEYGLNASKAIWQAATTEGVLAGDPSGDVATAMNEAGTATNFRPDQQKRAMIAIRKDIEEKLPEDRAKEQGKIYVNQISKCDETVQLDLHTDVVTNSKYQETVEYATSKIYNLDKSVQAEAYNISYKVAQESGNTRMLDALNSSYSQLDPEVQQSIASNPTYTQSMSNSAANAIANDSYLSSLIENESSAGTGLSKTDKEILREKWEAMSPAEKYNFICEMGVKNFGKMSPLLRKRILEHAKNDPVLMRRLAKTYGLNLLKTALFPDALGVIVRELLQDPAERIRVAREVCREASRYPASLVEDCQEILAEKENIKTEDFNQLSSLEKREALSDPAEYKYETGFASQSGANRNNIPKYEDKYSYFNKKSNLDFSS